MTSPGINQNWQWTGPNGFTHTGRVINLYPVAITDLGLFTASYTDEFGCLDSIEITISADNDSDGVDNSIDNCLNYANPQQTDTNNNNVGDLCETECTSFYILNATYPGGSILHFKAIDSINSNSLIEQNANMIFNAGQCILLDKDFEIEVGVNFEAAIL